MTAAILQGAPATTLDADLWIDLPARSYMRVLNLCVKLGARIMANTVVALEDDTLVNFLYRVDGLASFATEARRAVTLIDGRKGEGVSLLGSLGARSLLAARRI